jgi:LPXTG-site transpeptidase (sortase) family protein
MSQSKRKKGSLLNNHGSFRAENFFVAGLALVTLSAIVFLSIFYPLIRAEISYYFQKDRNVKVAGRSEAMVPVSGAEKFEVIQPIDENFGIVISKIGLNSKVVPDVDPEKAEIYQKSLAQGAAHALGSSYPGEEGNVFIFAHSGRDILEESRLNAVFYLLSKMEPGDEINIFFRNKKYVYLVKEKKTAGPEEIKYLEDTPGENTLTLMTCWPAGTNWKRLVVVAKQN